MDKSSEKNRQRLEGRRWRAAGAAMLMIALFASCTSRGCRSCQGCSSCRPGSEEQAAVPGKAEEPGKAGPVKPARADYHPIAELDSDTAAPEPEPGQEEYAGERREAIVNAGEGEEVPAAPEGLAVRVDDTVLVVVSWDKAKKGVTSFQIDKSSGGGPFSMLSRLTSEKNEYIDGPLPAGEYSYRVRAIGVTGAGPFAGPATVVVSDPEETPDAPEDLKAAPGPGREVKLNWDDASDNEEYFRVERAIKGDEFITVGRPGPNVSVFVDTRAEEGESLVYRVIAGNRAGESPPSNEAEVKLMPDAEVPAKPTDLAASVRGPTTAELNWSDNSDNEDRFLIEHKAQDREQYFVIKEAPADATEVLIGGLAPNTEYIFRVKAENGAGQSEPSLPVIITPPGAPLATYTMVVDPSGSISIEQPTDPKLPRLNLISVSGKSGALAAEIEVRNPDPDYKLRNVLAAVEYADQPGVMLVGCDRGPDNCSVDEGITKGVPVGYQYVEDGYLGEVPLGGETEYYPSRDRRYAVRDIWPSCGSVSVIWAIIGVKSRVSLDVVLYGEKAPLDFTRDPRYDPDKATWLIEPQSIGLDDERHEPGSRDNPSSRPLRYLKPGEVFAVNVSIEAADWMESQGLYGRVEDEPNARYIYWTALAFSLSYDPAVIHPIGKRLLMPDGALLQPGIRDPLKTPYQKDDGWTTESDDSYHWPFPDDGYLMYLFMKVAPQLIVEDGVKTCRYCGEGFVGPAGVIQGPDPDPEAVLGLFYFQVTGTPGSGSALRLATRPDTVIDLLDSNGTVIERSDDTYVNRWKEINMELAPTYLFPGEYQVQDSYLCVE